MVTSASPPTSNSYTENVRVRGWVIGILGLALGVTAGVMTGIAIRNMVGDEPIIEGANAAIFYATFAFAVLLDVFVLFNFTNLAVSVGAAGIEFRYGMFAKKLKWEQVKSAEPQGYSWKTFGGWGIRFSTQGRRAWSQLGVRTGVVVAVSEDGHDRSYFVSSRKPDALQAAIQEWVPSPGPVDAAAPRPISTES